MHVTQAVVLCGGKGTRLGSLARDVPKPLVPVGGRPVLDHVIETLARGGIRHFILAAGHLGELIRDHYASHDFAGCTIETMIEAQPLGTAGGLGALHDRLHDNFVVAYGDVFLDLDIRGLLAAHATRSPLATLLVRASDHPWDSHLVEADADGRVRAFIHHREPGRHYRNQANAGLYVVSRQILDLLPPNRATDFGADLFPAALAAGLPLHAHPLETAAFVKDMGTPQRLSEVGAYLEERAIADEARRRPAAIDTVFLDRDGVLNEHVGLVSRPDQLNLLPGAGEAVALLNRLGLRCIVVTNQPVVARGLCSAGGLEQIHARLRTLLAEAGGTLAGIYACHHHPDTQHGEGVLGLRRACRCRKPAPGLLFQARREQGIDLSRAILVGDRATDLLAARSAGIRAVLVGTPAERAAERAACPPDAEFDSLLAFAQALAEGRFPRA